MRLLKLYAWGHRSPDNPTTLEQALHRVTNHSERGRWADLLATLHRYDPGTDWLKAVGLYQQAAGLKELAKDWLGLAISLQKIGRSPTALRLIKDIKEWSLAQRVELEANWSRGKASLLDNNNAWIAAVVGGYFPSTSLGTRSVICGRSPTSTVIKSSTSR